MLPKLVPDEIAYLEIVRQLSVSNAKHFADMHKKAFLPKTLSFGDFTIVSTKSYEIIDKKSIEEYNLYEHYARKNYDPEGYIQSCKKSQNLGGYLHVSIKAKDIFRNMEDAEAKEVIDQLNNELVEKRQRLNEIETEEEEAETESDENAVVYKWQVPKKEEEPDVKGQIETALEVHANSRLEEFSAFVVDDVFIHSKEFKTFLYNFEGKKFRDSIPNIMPDNEGELLKRLKEEIDAEITTMTPQKGRQLLIEAGVILFPGWDLNASFIFNSLLHSENKEFKLDIQGVNDVFIGSRFGQDEESLRLWDLYPPHKRPKIIDVDKAFGHMMKLRVGEIDPIVSIDIGVDI